MMSFGLAITKEVLSLTSKGRRPQIAHILSAMMTYMYHSLLWTALQDTVKPDGSHTTVTKTGHQPDSMYNKVVVTSYIEMFQLKLTWEEPTAVSWSSDN